jgi:coenzyme F420-0:L-glutamate ligase / coenzyme F420-1:gamma-L-glutamate ligase
MVLLWNDMMRLPGLRTTTERLLAYPVSVLIASATITPGNRALELATITRKDARLVELVLTESSEVVRAAPNVLVTRHHNGCVMANAGIDRSNIGPGGEDRALLLPADCDLSASRLASGIADILGSAPAVLISDSFGRPWRNGVVCVALGVSGMPALIDRRGELDRDGRRLEVTQVALGDMVATAAGLVTGEGAEGVPAVLVRGFEWAAEPRPASALVRALEEDLFR